MTRHLCEVCGERVAEYECRLCSRKVCSEHYESERGICAVCRELLCEVCGNHLSVGICKYCGRLGCEKCLVQLTPVEYACIKCYRTSKGL